MGSSDRPKIIHTWCKTVGALKENNIPTMAMCGRCNWRKKPIDLDAIIAKHGPDYSLWDKHPHCPRCEDKYRLTFFYMGHGMMRAMRTEFGPLS